MAAVNTMVSLDDLDVHSWTTALVRDHIAQGTLKKAFFQKFFSWTDEEWPVAIDTMWSILKRRLQDIGSPELLGPVNKLAKPARQAAEKDIVTGADPSYAAIFTNRHTEPVPDWFTANLSSEGRGQYMECALQKFMVYAKDTSKKKEERLDEADQTSRPAAPPPRQRTPSGNSISGVSATSRARREFSNMDIDQEMTGHILEKDALNVEDATIVVLHVYLDVAGTAWAERIKLIPVRSVAHLDPRLNTGYSIDALKHILQFKVEASRIFYVDYDKPWEVLPIEDNADLGSAIIGSFHARPQHIFQIFLFTSSDIETVQRLPDVVLRQPFRFSYGHEPLTQLPNPAEKPAPPVDPTEKPAPSIDPVETASDPKGDLKPDTIVAIIPPATPSEIKSGDDTVPAAMNDLTNQEVEAMYSDAHAYPYMVLPEPKAMQVASQPPRRNPTVPEPKKYVVGVKNHERLTSSDFMTIETPEWNQEDALTSGEGPDYVQKDRTFDHLDEDTWVNKECPFIGMSPTVSHPKAGIWMEEWNRKFPLRALQIHTVVWVVRQYLLGFPMAIIAHEMGIGKTPIALGIAVLLGGLRRPIRKTEAFLAMSEELQAKYRNPRTLAPGTTVDLGNNSCGANLFIASLSTVKQWACEVTKFCKGKKIVIDWGSLRKGDMPEGAYTMDEYVKNKDLPAGCKQWEGWSARRITVKQLLSRKNNWPLGPWLNDWFVFSTHGTIPTKYNPAVGKGDARSGNVRIRWSLVIFDEFHELVGYKTNAWKLIGSLDGDPFLVPMSGTPYTKCQHIAAALIAGMNQQFECIPAPEESDTEEEVEDEVGADDGDVVEVDADGNPVVNPVVPDEAEEKVPDEEELAVTNEGAQSDSSEDDESETVEPSFYSSSWVPNLATRYKAVPQRSLPDTQQELLTSISFHRVCKYGHPVDVYYNNETSAAASGKRVARTKPPKSIEVKIHRWGNVLGKVIIRVKVSYIWKPLPNARGLPATEAPPHDTYDVEIAIDSKHADNLKSAWNKVVNAVEEEIEIQKARDANAKSATAKQKVLEKNYLRGMANLRWLQLIRRVLIASVFPDILSIRHRPGQSKVATELGDMLAENAYGILKHIKTGTEPHIFPHMLEISKSPQMVTLLHYVRGIITQPLSYDGTRKRRVIVLAYEPMVVALAYWCLRWVIENRADDEGGLPHGTRILALHVRLNSKEKVHIIDQSQTDLDGEGCEILVAQGRVIEAGLNLGRSDCMISLDTTWTLRSFSQAFGRIRRNAISQKSPFTEAFRLISTAPFCNVQGWMNMRHETPGEIWDIIMDNVEDPEVKANMKRIQVKSAPKVEKGKKVVKVRDSEEGKETKQDSGSSAAEGSEVKAINPPE